MIRGRHDDMTREEKTRRQERTRTDEKTRKLEDKKGEEKTRTLQDKKMRRRQDKKRCEDKKTTRGVAHVEGALLGHQPVMVADDLGSEVALDASQERHPFATFVAEVLLQQQPRLLRLVALRRRRQRRVPPPVEPPQSRRLGRRQSQTVPALVQRVEARLRTGETSKQRSRASSNVLDLAI